MWNLLLSVGASGVVFLVFLLSGLLSAFEAVAPAVVALVATYFVCARRTFKAAESIFNEASKSLTAVPPRIDLAVSTLERAYPLSRWQFGVRSQVDTQIGVIYFLQQEFKKAEPYLEKAGGFGHWLGGAMLGVIHYKKKDHAAMRATFDGVVKKARGQGLPWTLYAYLLTQIGEREAAQSLLARAAKKTKQDSRVQEALLAVQNGKKINMRGYKEQWYQFHLERPPQQQGFAPGGKVTRMERRGRW